MHLPLRLPTRQLMVCFALLLMLLGGRTARAQSIHWSSGYPSLDNDRIVTLENERTLRIRIAALGSDVNNATIVVTLPSGQRDARLTRHHTVGKPRRVGAYAHRRRRR